MKDVYSDLMDYLHGLFNSPNAPDWVDIREEVLNKLDDLAQFEYEKGFRDGAQK